MALDAAGNVLERLDATSDPKGAVMHVGAIGEIPDLVVRPARKAVAAQRIIATREDPGFRDEPAQLGPPPSESSRTGRRSALVTMGCRHSLSDR